MNIKKFFSLVLTILCLVGCSNGCIAPTYIQTREQRYIDNTHNVNHILNSTVAFMMVEEGVPHAFCTGFYVSPRLIASAAHCFSEESVSIPELHLTLRAPANVGTNYRFITYDQFVLNTTLDQEITLHTARIIAVDNENDVALLKLYDDEQSSEDYLRINDTTIRIGEPVYTCGHPLSVYFLLSSGIVSQVLRGRDGRIDQIFATSPIYMGNSGGFLINDRGEVVGVAKAIGGRQSFLGLYVPSRYVSRLINNL